jgi:hypothetical protein
MSSPTARAHHPLSEPAMPSILWLALLIPAFLLPWEMIAWASFGGAAGYALSGSV